jgi:hypothetical protein
LAQDVRTFQVLPLGGWVPALSGGTRCGRFVGPCGA